MLAVRAGILSVPGPLLSGWCLRIGIFVVSEFRWLKRYQIKKTPAKPVKSDANPSEHPLEVCR